jgi:hypothetical protein
MVEWTKHLPFFGLGRLAPCEVDLGLGWQVTKERPQTLMWSYVDLAAKDISNPS